MGRCAFFRARKRWGYWMMIASGELSTTINPVECLVSAGGILAMRPLLIHSSSKSQAEVDRRVLHIEYAASSSIAAPLNLARSQILFAASQTRSNSLHR